MAVGEHRDRVAIATKIRRAPSQPDRRLGALRVLVELRLRRGEILSSVALVSGDWTGAKSGLPSNDVASGCRASCTLPEAIDRIIRSAASM